jgi:hypothetical protein
MNRHDAPVHAAVVIEAGISDECPTWMYGENLLSEISRAPPHQSHCLEPLHHGHNLVSLVTGANPEFLTGRSLGRAGRCVPRYI